MCDDQVCSGPVVLSEILRLGFGLTVTGERHIPRRGPIILAPNVRSDIDAVVLGAAVARRCTFLAAADCSRDLSSEG